MKKPYLFLFICISCFIKSQYLWQIEGDKIIKWNYFDGDEFNTNTVDKNKWKTTLPWSRAVISQDIIYTDSNITFNNGIIRFAINNKENWVTLADWEIDSAALAKSKLQKKDQKTFLFKYTGGLLYSHKEYLYGYFEIKFKAPTGKGIWPAFWLYGAKPNNEIDFFELKGEKENELHVDIHCPNGCSNFKEGWFGYRRGWGHWLKTDNKLHQEYNIVAGEWTKDYIKWYLNGKLIAYSNHSFEIPMCLTAGTGIAKDGGPFKPGPDKLTPFPNYFDVDYIRVYKSDVQPNIEEISKSISRQINQHTKDTVSFYKTSKKSKVLKNNPDKKIKQKNTITISVMPISSSQIQIRALGIQKTDVVKIFLKEGENIISQLDCKENSEYIIPTNFNGRIELYAEVNGKIISQKLIE